MSASKYLETKGQILVVLKRTLFISLLEFTSQSWKSPRLYYMQKRWFLWIFIFQGYSIFFLNFLDFLVLYFLQTIFEKIINDIWLGFSKKTSFWFLRLHDFRFTDGIWRINKWSFIKREWTLKKQPLWYQTRRICYQIFSHDLPFKGLTWLGFVSLLDSLLDPCFYFDWYGPNGLLLERRDTFFKNALQTRFCSVATF